MSSPEKLEMRTSTPEQISTEKAAALSNPAGSSIDEHNEIQPKVHAKTFLVVFAVCLIYVAQDFTLVGAGAQGNAIAAHFGSSAVSWITAPVTILTVVLSPIVSHAADYWGRKWFLIVLSFFGAIGALVVAQATSMSMVIAGFTLIGVAFGAQPLLHTVASEVLPRRWRASAQACIMISNGVGLGGGLIVGGPLNEHGNPNGFRNFFYIAMALFILSALTCFVAYVPPPTKLQAEFTTGQKIASLDWIGYGLLASSLVLFCIGLSWSQNPYPWSDPHVSATFAIGVALAIVLVVYEWRFKKDGMFHHGLFKNNRNFVIAIGCVFAEGIAFFAANIYFAFEVGVLYETNVLIVGVRFAIAFLATIIGSACTGVYCGITKKVKWVTFTAFVIFTAFFVCMATAKVSSSTQVWGYPVLMGWGLGMTLVALVTIAQLSVPPELISIASGLLISVRSLGGTIGIAIYNAVFTSTTSQMGGNVSKAAVGAGLPTDSIPQFVADIIAQNATGLATIDGVSPTIIGAGAGAVLGTYELAFRNVWLTAIPFIVIALVASTFLSDPTAEFNNHIDAPVEKEEELYSS